MSESSSNRSFGRPALVRLEQHHDELITELREGFTSLDEVILWSQRLAVRTLGVMEDDLFRRIGSDRILWTAFITTEDWRKYSSNPVTPEAARETRLLFEATFVLPATRNSFRRLRKSAGEYFDEQFDETVSVAGEEFIAMRPALNHLETRQREVLNNLLNGGVDGGQDDLLDWLRDLTAASYGQIDQSLQMRSYREKTTREVLLGEFGEDAEGSRARQKFSFEFLLPAFNAGARKLVGKAGEDVEGGGTTNSANDHLSA